MRNTEHSRVRQAMSSQSRTNTEEDFEQLLSRYARERLLDRLSLSRPPC